MINAVRSTDDTATWELGIFAHDVTAAVCTFALKAKPVFMAISQKISLQKQENVINPQKINSCTSS